MSVILCLKYASEKQLQKAIKRVRHERKKIYDEKQWIQFLEKKHKELISPVVNETKNEFAQQLHKEQTFISGTVQLNSNNIGHEESTLKCKTCGHMRNINAEQGEQQISLLGQSVSNTVGEYLKRRRKTKYFLNILKEITIYIYCM